MTFRPFLGVYALPILRAYRGAAAGMPHGKLGIDESARHAGVV